MTKFIENKFVSKFIMFTIFVILNGNMADGHKMVKREIPRDYPALLKNGNMNDCTGQPLDSKTVLTSARCVSLVSSIQLYGDNAEVSNILSAPYGTTSSIILHPDYSPDFHGSSLNDIAIIQFWKPIPFTTPYNGLAKLATSAPTVNEAAVDARWFLNVEPSFITNDTWVKEGRRYYSLEQTNVTVVECNGTPGIICASAQSHKLCYNPLGEPLWSNDKLVGIAVEVDCSQKDTIIVKYVDVSRHRKWITDTVTNLSKK